MPYPAAEAANFQYIVVEIEPAFGLSRDQLMAVLHEEKVFARRYFYPGCHRMPAYAKVSQRDLPHTDALAARILCLPTGTSVETGDIAAICGVFQAAFSEAAAIRSVLPELG